MLLALFGCTEKADPNNDPHSQGPQTPAQPGKVYIIVTDTSFAPFEFPDAQGNYIGIDMEILAAIAKDQGFEYTVNPIGFNAALQALSSGEADGMIAGMNKGDITKIAKACYPAGDELDKFVKDDKNAGDYGKGDANLTAKNFKAEENGDKATATVTITLKGKIGNMSVEYKDLECKNITFRKIDGKWYHADIMYDMAEGIDSYYHFLVSDTFFAGRGTWFLPNGYNNAVYTTLPQCPDMYDMDRATGVPGVSVP